MLGVIEHNQTDLGPLLTQVGASMTCIATLAVIARFAARRLEHIPYWWDDWFILASLPGTIGLNAMEMAAVTYGGYGRHIKAITAELMTKAGVGPDVGILQLADLIFQSEIVITAMKLLYATQIIYPTCMLLIKMSIIAFYRRVFSIESTKIPLYTVAGIIIVWWLACLFLAIFSCSPIASFWTRFEVLIGQASCIDNRKYWIGNCIPNILTDVVLVVFPMPIVWQLKLPFSQKVALTCIFAIAGFIIVISSLRLAAALQLKDYQKFSATPDQQGFDRTWNQTGLGIFNMVEISVATLLACLPSMRPLLRFVLRQSLKRTSSPAGPKTYWKRSKDSPPKRLGDNGDNDSFKRLHGSIEDTDLESAGVCRSESQTTPSSLERELELKEMEREERVREMEKEKEEKEREEKRREERRNWTNKSCLYMDSQTSSI